MTEKAPGPIFRAAIAGCGSVSSEYLADLRDNPDVQVVALCDILPERARTRAAEFGIPAHFGSVDEMLVGADFSLLVNTTSMPAHGAVNRAGLQAGKDVWSEKPFAATLEEARDLMRLADERGARLYAAPTTVTSPAFRCMAETLHSGRIGPVYAARAWYGHGGPGWGPWFYQKGGGAMFDLAVYNITTLTGLLGPARAVTALMGSAIPTREVEGVTVQVEADDNVALLMDHGGCVFSCVQSGFVYGPYAQELSVEIVGVGGSVSLLGWDWLPRGVALRPSDGPRELLTQGTEGYSWRQGVSHLAACRAAGVEPAMTLEHAYHVLEVMLAARESSDSGRRMAVSSTFQWPIYQTDGAAGIPAAPPATLDPDRHNR
jgi:predicted dehydrogenase